MISGKTKIWECGNDYRPAMGCIEPLGEGKIPWQLWWYEDGHIEIYMKNEEGHNEEKPSVVLPGC